MTLIIDGLKIKHYLNFKFIMNVFLESEDYRSLKFNEIKKS